MAIKIEKPGTKTGIKKEYIFCFLGGTASKSSIIISDNALSWKLSWWFSRFGELIQWIIL